MLIPSDWKIQKKTVIKCSRIIQKTAVFWGKIDLKL
jgi:hypothetical protein